MQWAFLLNRFQIWGYLDFSNLSIYLSIYLFMAMLGLCCCVQAFSSCGEWGLLFVAVASVVAEHGLQARGLSSCGSRALEHRLSSCGARAQLLHRMSDLPGPGLEPVSPALAGGFLTTAPPAKSRFFYFKLISLFIFLFTQTKIMNI